MKTTSLIIALLATCVVFADAHSAMAAEAGQASDVKAFFRAGQTFITWKEADGVKEYKIYRSDKPIASLADAKAVKCVATVPKGSDTYQIEIARKGPLAAITGKPGYGSRFVIEDNPTADPAKMLPEGVGLFVYTPKEAGTFFYAVTAVGADGENDAQAEGNKLAKGVEEKPGPIGAVLLFQRDTIDKKASAKTGVERMYCHWMDADDWNPGPTGGYAFNFGVAIPEKPRGLCMQFHGFSGYSELHGPLADMVTVIPGDPYQCWFYGHKDASGKKVCNYSERRMLMTVDFVLRQCQAEGIKVDANKVYIHGGSMGGTGGNFLGAWHGDVFAAVLASKGAVDHNRNGNWTGDAQTRLWGTKEENLPTNDGDKVWDHLNLIKWHVNNMEKETAFFLDAHASNDESVPFGAVPEYYEALQKAKRPFAAVWGPWGHSGFQDPHWPNHEWWGVFKFNKDESVPAIGNASSNDVPKAGGHGEINTHIEWSSRENKFDKTADKAKAVDEPTRWEMSFRTCNYHRSESQQKDVDKQTADITPRRCQKFKPVAGQKYHWENWSWADPEKPVKLAEGAVTADKYGLVTVEKFEINKAGLGNRLILSPER